MFSLGGLFSLRRPWGVLAFWFPTIFFMKATIPFINLDQEWLEGRKWTVWTPGTLLVAVGCVVLFLFFLTCRERRRISQWSTGQPRAWRLEGGGRGVWRRAIEATVLVLILSASTALISPFLWNRIRNEKGTEARQGEQTGSDRGQNDSASGDRDQSSGNSSEGQPQTDPGRGEGDVSQPAANEPGGGGADSGGESPPDRTQDSSGIEARREGQEGEDSGRDPSSGSGQAPDEESSGSGATSGAAQRILPWLFLLLLWALLWRPLKRLSLIRSWLDPNSRESPTQRIEHAWRAVRTVLEDYRQVPRAAETPASFCRRITETWPGAGESLQSASSVADIRDRVFFGLFVEPGDVENSRQLAAAAYENLWRRQTWWGKLRALYRDLD